ncbi:hypothetical protein NPX13_g6161 [Xylaria arbuscula]|uniref:Uncharacterized protein n=1 Tax=Xylaria arbuscula TaxID=114810 RepID=A0A9W8NCR5_9PEZI|nr:hypothetical protein NPX13_g6161 [Xylaria arbuscula]
MDPEHTVAIERDSPKDGRPFSPWAQRHGLEKWCLDPVFQRRPNFHSSYAPEHALYYADGPNLSNVGVFQDGNEIDRVFFSEINREELFAGMEIWQLGPLNQRLKFSNRLSLPGGHQRGGLQLLAQVQGTAQIQQLIDKQEMIMPDEHSWFTFFQRDRWFDGDYKDPILNFQPWSVDHPDIGLYMSIAMELANRMLLALIDEQHPFINTLLYGYVGSWRIALRRLDKASVDRDKAFHEERVLISYAQYKQDESTADEEMRKYMEKTQTYSPDDVKKKFEHLLSLQRWGFQASEDPVEGQDCSNDVILLNSYGLATLLNPETTLAERCIKLLHLAVTILHEICHATFRRRVQLELPKFHKYRDDEPWWRANQLNPWSEEGLTDHTFDYLKGHPDFEVGRSYQRTLLPAEYASKLLSAEFWEDGNIPRKTDNFFHRKAIFVSHTLKTPSNKDVTSWRRIVNPVEIAPSFGTNATLTSSERTIVNSWRRTERLWDQARSYWYENQRSLWAHRSVRRRIAAFKHAFRKRDLALCSEHADFLVHFNNFPRNSQTGRQEYLDAIVEQGSHRWLFHVIGLLMLASFPIQHKDQLVRSEGWIAYGVSQFTPSSAAAGQQNIKMNNQKRQSRQLIRESLFYNPITQANVPSPTVFSQRRYLNLVQNIIEYLAFKGTHISTPWLNEILRVEGSLRESRRLLTKDHGNQHTGMWAGVWDFATPQYDPVTMSHWSGLPVQQWTLVPYAPAYAPAPN